VYLFISDMHFGRQPAELDRESERDLVACLRHYQDAVRGLYLVGDVFDPFIEYRHLMPKGFIRFLGILAEYADSRIPITVFAGNHDPWHQDFFRIEFGARIVMDAIEEEIAGHVVHVTHGDGVTIGAGLSRRLRPVLRHPLPVALYRNLLPGDLGMRLAHFTNRAMKRARLDPKTINGLRGHARSVVRDSDVNLVIMGHSHFAELSRWPEGVYLNTGSWQADRSFGTLDEEGPRVLRWNGTCVIGVDAPA
jgi:UDP-2,3-diacylglucosamine hydrolase